MVGSIVPEESVGRGDGGVCGDEEVEVAVEVVVAPCGSGAFGCVVVLEESVDPSGLGDIGEVPVAIGVWPVVHHEQVLSGLRWKMRGSERGDVDIEVSVVVEVGDGCAVGMERSIDVPALGVVGEGAVLVVDEEFVGVERSELEDVVVPVVVEVCGDASGDHNGVELSAALRVLGGESGLFGLIGEEEGWIAGGGRRDGDQEQAEGEGGLGADGRGTNTVEHDPDPGRSMRWHAEACDSIGSAGSAQPSRGVGFAG